VKLEPVGDKIFARLGINYFNLSKEKELDMWGEVFNYFGGDVSKYSTLRDVGVDRIKETLRFVNE